MRPEQKPRRGGAGDDQHRAEINRKRETATEFAGDESRGQTHLGDPLQRRPALVDQVIADVSGGLARLTRGNHFAEFDRLAGNLEFTEMTALGDGFNGVAIAIAGGEIHRRINSRRLSAEDLLDNAHLLHELAPVHRAEKPQAGDAVADRNLVGGLVLVLRLNELLDGQPLILQAMLHPTGGKAEVGALSVEMAGEFGDKRAAERNVGAGHVGEDQNQIGRILLDDLHHPIGPLIGDVTVMATRGDAGGNAAQILDQCQPQHNRNAPQLAESKRLDRLV
jgi:hypothetical protein